MRYEELTIEGRNAVLEASFPKNGWTRCPPPAITRE